MTNDTNNDRQIADQLDRVAADEGREPELRHTLQLAAAEIRDRADRLDLAAELRGLDVDVTDEVILAVPAAVLDVLRSHLEDVEVRR